jgi:uncharacterized damage-inducible protein DinB
MMFVSHLRRMAQYNRWMNERLFACCATLTDEQRKRDVGAYFRSIHGTLNHLLLADCIWLGRFAGTPFHAATLDQELHADFEDLRQARAATDDAIDRWVEELTEQQLASTLSYTSMVNPQPRSYPYWFAAAGFFNHQTHHRGQLTTLLFQQGVDPGLTDLIWLPQAQPVVAEAGAAD